MPTDNAISLEEDGITVRSRTTRSTAEVSAAEWNSRQELAACYRAVDMYGWSALTGNHISVRVPGEPDHFLVNEYGLTYREITASNLVKIDMQGRVVGSQERRVNYAGFIIHSAVHEAREDAHCVIHTHTIEDNAVGALEDGLLSLNQQSAHFHGQVAYHDYEGPALNPEEQTRLQENLGENAVLVLRNHGMLAVGETVAEAFMLTYHFQTACKMQIATLSCGRPYRVISGEAERAAANLFRKFRKTSPNLSWEAVLRRINLEQPGYSL
jgi:ribulose-5-phosphate 4-epimerase/fuculose-1-phosphate aldolase